jgi:hypothetical protein
LPPAEVARRYAGAVPAAAEDARAVVEAYCRSEFGGERLSGNEVREVTDRIRRLRKLA